MDEDEEAAIEELKSMSHEELLLVQHSKLKWICAGKGCCRSTKIFDFGIYPSVYHPKMKSKWMNIYEYYFMCSKHWKIYRRLIKNYPENKVAEKLFDFDKKRTERL